MTTYLLDANVVIALAVAEHEHHERASDWLETIDSFAVSPVIEGALVRFLVRLGERAASAAQVVRAVHAADGYQFWADDQSYGTIDLTHVRGHHQVTDAYLLGLVRAHDKARNPARLATLDEALAQRSPELVVLLL